MSDFIHQYFLTTQFGGRGCVALHCVGRDIIQAGFTSQHVRVNAAFPARKKRVFERLEFVIFNPVGRIYQCACETVNFLPDNLIQNRVIPLAATL